MNHLLSKHKDIAAVVEKRDKDRKKTETTSQTLLKVNVTTTRHLLITQKTQWFFNEFCIWQNSNKIISSYPTVLFVLNAMQTNTAECWCTIGLKDKVCYVKLLYLPNIQIHTARYHIDGKPGVNDCSLLIVISITMCYSIQVLVNFWFFSLSRQPVHNLHLSVHLRQPSRENGSGTKTHLKVSSETFF